MRDSWEKNKARRAACRRQARPATNGPLKEKSLCQSYAVKDPTAVSYHRMWTELGRWWMKGRKVRARQPPTDDEMGKALTEWCDVEFLNGEHSDHGARMVSAVKYVRTDFGRHGTRKLPETAQALQGWRAKAPSRAPLPLPGPVNSLRRCGRGPNSSW